MRIRMHLICTAMLSSMSRAFTSTSGTYNVHATELSSDSKKTTVIVTSVVLLDDTQHTFHIPKKSKGSALLDLVFKHLDLIEKDYFGLQFTENGSPPSAANLEITHWVDENKYIKKQARGVQNFWLAVRFYPPEPSRLAEEYTRYLLCLQIRRLLLDGRMVAPKNTELLLASYTVQAELGDFNAESTQQNLSKLRLLSKQTPEDEHKIGELHKLHRGQLSAEADISFLEHAKRLDAYGVDSHPAQDSNGRDIFIGVTSNGLVIFQNNIRINTFSWAKIVKLTFKRKKFFIQLKREPCENYDSVLGFNMRSSRAAKILWKSSVEQHSFFRLNRPRQSKLVRVLSAIAKASDRPRIQRTHTQALEDAKRATNLHRVFVRSSSIRFMGNVTAAPRISSPRVGGRVTCATPAPIPRPAWNGPETQATPAAQTPSDDELHLPYADDSDASTAPSLITVRLAPGKDGRFGFNVRGGKGQALRVARVAAHTPAHHAPLRQGDQVIAINGIEVEDMSHEQVVQMIRSTKGILTLTIRPNGGADESGTEEPECWFVPLEGGGEKEPHEQALLLLADGLASGAALQQYDALPRLVNYTLHPPQQQDRYRDITPYEKSRVILKNGPNGDYINASYINMEIPQSDQVLTYIATQGPLPTTVGDFWQMMWECESELIVMLTVLSERGRAKCHQYWANLDNELKTTDTLRVQTVSEEPDEHGNYVHRRLILTNTELDAKRTIHQLQYLAWPDHGVPHDSTAFIQFTKLCSDLRQKPTADDEGGGGPPMVVHCSAGVGRTGALILCETAMELLSRKQPFYPLDLVKHMRDQRPMCIQNSTQYKFVCESILEAYNQEIIGPERKT